MRCFKPLQTVITVADQCIGLLAKESRSAQLPLIRQSQTLVCVFTFACEKLPSGIQLGFNNELETSPFFGQRAQPAAKCCALDKDFKQRYQSQTRSVNCGLYGLPNEDRDVSGCVDSSPDVKPHPCLWVCWCALASECNVRRELPCMDTS